MKYKITIDVDGTIADIHRMWAKKVSELYKTDFTLEDITDWNWGEKARSLGLTFDDCLNLYKRIWLDEWQSIPLTDPFVINTLNFLINEYDVDIVSAELIEEKIKSWLDYNSIPYKKVIFTDKKSELSYDVFIDDNPELTKKLQSNRLIIYNRPWNINVNGFERILKFSEAPEAIENLLSLQSTSPVS